MLSRSPLSSLHCPGCDHTLSRDELELYDLFDGLCEECYAGSMKSVYEDNDDGFLGEDDQSYLKD